MSLVAIGINHKTAPVSIRERVAFAPERLKEALHQLVSVSGVEEAAIVSTCNRTEVYSRLSANDDAPLTEWFRNYHQLSLDDLTPYLFVHRDREAVRHMLRVASGLDSLILGEPQILGQIKSAYIDADQARTLGAALNRLFQHAFATAKRVRTDTAIGSSPVSVAFAAVALAKQIFGELGQSKALLIGAGETIELAARHLHANGIRQIVVANRTFERAHALAQQFDGYGIALEELPQHLHEADILISSTAAPLPILGKGAVERALKRRKRKPIFMVDIAVPRDIEQEVAKLDDVYLYTVDDLEEVIEEGRRSRQEAAEQAEEIIDTQVEHFQEWLRAQQAVNIIRDFRDQAERERDALLVKARQMLEKGKPAEEALTFLANTLTNKLIHHPTRQLNLACREGDAELIDAARLLLNLDNDRA